MEPVHGVNLGPTVEGIVLDGRPLLKLCVGPYLIGYFATVAECIAAAQERNINLNDLTFKEN